MMIEYKRNNHYVNRKGTGKTIRGTVITSVYDDRVQEEQPLGQKIVVEYIKNIHYAQTYW